MAAERDGVTGPPRHVPALDGLRGLAIVLVLAHQLCIDGYAGPGAALVTRVRVPLQAGWVGVQDFFVLSGFLITGILLDTRGSPRFWSAFYARRALRILPLYYLMLAGVWLLLRPLPDEAMPVLYVAFVANLAPVLGRGSIDALGPCWSLSVEEQFYLVWPLVVRFVSERALLRVCVGVVVGAFALRVALLAVGADHEIAYELTPARADALAMGAAVALCVRRPELRARAAARLPLATWFLCGALALAGVASGGLSRVHPVAQTLGYWLVAAVSATMLLWVDVRPGGRLAAALSQGWLRTFGRYSYAIYLVHHPIDLWIQRHWLAPLLASLTAASFLALQVVYLLVMGGVLVAIGALSYRLVEKPMLDLRRFFDPRSAT